MNKNPAAYSRMVLIAMSKKINKILMRRWMNLEVWRFVCLVFAVIGLLSYAFNPDFNHLYGKWNWWKTLVYGVISITICLAAFFTEAQKGSPSLEVTALLSLVVMTAANIYGHYSDVKLEEIKTNPYNLIWSASFAIMSLCFSIPRQCGFQRELLSFFCSILMVQLMQINVRLIVGGVAFTAFLFFLRFSLDLEEKERMESLPTNRPLDSSNSGQTSTGTTPVNAHDDCAPLLVTSENEDHELLQQQLASPGDNQGNISTDIGASACIDKLKEKNQLVVDEVAKQVDRYLKAMQDYSKSPAGLQRPQIDFNLVLDLVVQLCSEEFNDLREVVKLMVKAGLEKECREVCSDWRREFLQGCLESFGLRELKMEGNDLKKKTKSWKKALNVAVRILLPMEARFHDFASRHLFNTEDTSFTEVRKELTTQLLSYVDSLVKGTHSLDLLCCIIPEVGDTLCDLLHDPFIESIKIELDKIWKRLGEATRGIFTELENLIHSDMDNQKKLEGIPPVDLHHIVLQVMKCLWDVSKFSDVILREAFDREGKSSFSMHIARIIEFLESNLEAKLKDFTNPAFGYLFMMNNLKWIRRLAAKYELKSKLGPEWVQKNKEKVQQNLELYIESSWNKLLDYLKLDNNVVTAETMKEKLDSFNLHFEKIFTDQFAWFVFDERLREQIRNSIEDILLPAYENFIRKLYDVLGKQPYPYIECDVLDIQSSVNNLFMVIKRRLRFRE